MSHTYNCNSYPTDISSSVFLLPGFGAVVPTKDNDGLNYSGGKGKKHLDLRYIFCIKFYDWMWVMRYLGVVTVSYLVFLFEQLDRFSIITEVGETGREALFVRDLQLRIYFWACWGIIFVRHRSGHTKQVVGYMNGSVKKSWTRD